MAASSPIFPYITWKGWHKILHTQANNFYIDVNAIYDIILFIETLYHPVEC